MTSNNDLDPSRFTTQANVRKCLSENVREAMESYFDDLEGHDVSNLYELFLSQVEKPLLEVVLEKTGGNITRASAMLGLNRGTLRTRLKKYGIE